MACTFAFVFGQSELLGSQWLTVIISHSQVNSCNSLHERINPNFLSSHFNQAIFKKKKRERLTHLKYCKIIAIFIGFDMQLEQIILQSLWTLYVTGKRTLSLKSAHIWVRILKSPLTCCDVAGSQASQSPCLKFYTMTAIMATWHMGVL